MLISGVGLAFALDPSITRIPPGTDVTDCRLEVGDCVLEGDFLVKSSACSQEGGNVLGGLFEPRNDDSEQKLAAIIAGIDAAEPIYEAQSDDEDLDLPQSDETTDTGTSGRPRYDPAFSEAVEAGYLTQHQAMQRGKRDVLAKNLANRHKLSEANALAVADNRIPLLAAVRKQNALKVRSDSLTTPVALSQTPASESTPASASVAIALFGVLVIALSGMLLSTSTLDSGPRLGSGVSIHTDNDGQIVQIEGPDPAAVLAAYCAADETRSLESIGLVQADAARSTRKLGLLRDKAAPDEPLAIYISKSRVTRRWEAGDGRRPLIAFQAPQGETVEILPSDGG